MKEKVIMKPNGYHKSPVLVSRRRLKNKECVLMKLDTFELCIPSKQITGITDAMQVQLIVTSLLLQEYKLPITQAQEISALMIQELKTKKKKLACWEA